MSAHTWEIMVGVLMSALLALGPWMFMVHAKLAVIATQIQELGEKVEKSSESSNDLWSRYAHHETRLGTHDVLIAHLENRWQE